MICFDLYEMGEQLKPTAMNVVLEAIQNRVAANRLAGKYTWVFIDEIYLFFKYYYSAQFLYKCWKRFRKYSAAMTGATQNVEECLRSDTARLMFANSEFLILLNQAATDRAELAKLLNISETQMGHVRHPGECDGQSGYGVDKLDKLVDQIIRIQLGRIQNAPPQELIEKQQAKELELIKSKLKLLNDQYRQKQREYQDLRAETIKVIQGTSRLNVDLLNSLVEETSDQIKQLEQQIQATTTELEETLRDASQVLREYDQLGGWAEMYDNCTFEAKKMIVAQFVKAVRVRRDYEIDIEFNVSFEEFQALYLEGEPEESKGPGGDTLLAIETKARQAV